MPGLHRHQLAYPDMVGWEEVLASALPAGVAQRLREWADLGLPLVVTRQSEDLKRGRLALAWAGPLCAGRCRVALQIDAASVHRFAEFPEAREALPLVPRESRAALALAFEAMNELAMRPRVYGSYGWQLLTGQPYVRAESDLDVWIGVRDREQADAAAQLLHACSSPALRVDGELVFADGCATAWREYAAWRAGRSLSLLVKRLDGVGLAKTLAEAIEA